ncbi:ATP-binding domain-containing protein [Alteriqipengyuania sp. WL0013]|uniref:nuclease-related domain-containing DEAD/DEAH box helicase n=1 Tax=Alteriqipengyuania sp. WL0013 TaxID=3110773 RepID=UPI002CE563F2|nr:ATP-binding domain-containing protein [Alteriqipengyuania sp. WL0013]MEB3415013.1 ATP-binding domain-containing protein [Alteriqipengyuania sp. WL0013]
MAICIPPLELARSESSAELDLFKALSAQLDDGFTIMHSIAWIAKPRRGAPRDGECDFLIAHPHFGLLVLEVKGGRVFLDYQTQKWISIDRGGNPNPIKNPFEQAKGGKYSILEKLKESSSWQRLGIRRFNIGHAAFFPGIGNGQQLRGPDAPIEIIGDRNDMDNLQSWVTQALNYWSENDSNRVEELGQRGVDSIVATFARRVSTRPLLSARIQDEERERIVLTQKQAQILDILQRQRRVMVAGGAGTGKTLIAREKAFRTANEGLETLLVCFNRPLADFLREQCKDIDNLDVASFHQVCSAWTSRAKKVSGRDFLAEARRDHPRANEFDHIMPIALANAIDSLGPKYDAIIIDEAQDFGDEFWLPIEMLLTDLEQGLLYVFLDENQDIYRRSGNIPVNSEPMILDQNCRNTGAVHRAAYKHYRGIDVRPSPIEGVEVVSLPASSRASQAKSIASLITKLVVEEQIAPHDIAVLICDKKAKAEYEEALCRLPIPKPARFGRLEDFGPNVLTVDTVARFKGLERDIVILWAFDDLSAEHDRETFYVGMSRAKSSLYLCGDRARCDKLLSD